MSLYDNPRKYSDNGEPMTTHVGRSSIKTTAKETLNLALLNLQVILKNWKSHMKIRMEIDSMRGSETSNGDCTSSSLRDVMAISEFSS